MFLALFYLLATLNPAIEIIREHHLETAQEKELFLTEKLLPYAKAANQLNIEIQALAERIKGLSSKEEQPQILLLTEEMTQKMARLSEMLPVLNIALSVNEDLQEINIILEQENPLTVEQQDALDRIIFLSNSIK